MADKAYVMVKIAKVEKAFDNKYKTSIPKVMKTAAEAAIKGSSAMTTAKPTDKDAKAYTLDMTVNALNQTPAGLDAKLTLTVSEDDHAFGFANASGKLPAGNAKSLDRDVEDLIKGIITDLVQGKVNDAVKGKGP
jgi:hypothetical protein